VSLPRTNEAHDLVALIAEAQPERLEHAAVRWHCRLELEAQLLMLVESELALAALGAVRADPPRSKFCDGCSDARGRRLVGRSARRTEFGARAFDHPL
jgi:hypothetical protein